MIEQNEKDIMKDWNTQMSAPVVSILSTVYNHEEFLEKCLDGFLSQKTDFCFEIIIHDDASTDKSGDIIRKYANKYPNIVKPILQKENQFSKGISILNDILYPKAKGKYIALCEGDDYWIDDSKLQMQYEFMESHPECAMCVHNSIIHDLLSKKDKLFNNWNKEKMLSPEDIFIGWSVHTSSYFMLRDIVYMPKEMRYWFGDYVVLTMAILSGQIGYIPKTMSQYNYNNTSGVTYKNCLSVKLLLNKEKERIEYLEKYDVKSKYLYHELITKIVDIKKIKLHLLQFDICDSKCDYLKIREELRSGRYLLKECTGKERIKYYITTLSYCSYRLYYLLRKVIKNR